MKLSTAIVLGPQRREPILCEALDDLVGSRRASVALVTAGWEEREDEDEELREHVCRPVENLRIWARVERILDKDKELLKAMRERHATLRRVQDLYRLRLEGLMEPTRELLQRVGEDPWVDAEEQDAWELVRGLDRQHMARVAEIHAEFEQRVRPTERAVVQKERRELEDLLAGVSCLLVAGGHIGVLLHRLRLFELCRLWGDRPVVAWSAGAMALTERIVLFHDSPPQGSSYAEVMEAGFGLLPGFVALPHATHRLQTSDTVRVQLLSRRFAPALCGLLDYGVRWDFRDDRWHAHTAGRRLGENGKVEEVAR
ncbi:MAG: Type 1 glutamine amidotransferase-like domain-containing protein [Planctomycetota bacterium]